MRWCCMRLLINGVLGLAFSALVLAFGPAALSRARRRGRLARRGAAPIPTWCSRGTVLVWLMNALASVIRGTGNMLVPALGDLRRRGAADPALALPDLRPRPVPGARHRRRRLGGGADDGADRRGARRVHPRRALARAVPAGAAALGAVSRHPARGRGGGGEHAADGADRRADHRAGRARMRARRRWRATAPARGSNIC